MVVKVTGSEFVMPDTHFPFTVDLSFVHLHVPSPAPPDTEISVVSEHSLDSVHASIANPGWVTEVC